jgi:hypothetical protein
MLVLKSRIFKNGMTKKVKHVMGNTFEVQYSNCNKEDIYSDILKLEKVFECVLFRGCKVTGFNYYYEVLCYNPKIKYLKKLSEV